jgi:hypothetical protein
MSSNVISQCLTTGNAVFNCLDISKRIQQDEIERQIAATFIFGCINAVALEEKMQPPQVHAVMLKILTDNFKYSDEQAVDFFQLLTESTLEGNNPTMHFIVHRGIDGYYQYAANAVEQLKQNYDEVLTRINA